MSVNQERWANIIVVSAGTQALIEADYPSGIGQMYIGTDNNVTYVANQYDVLGGVIPVVGFTPYTAVTATYTITAYDYTVDCTANTFTVTLPTAVGITGRVYTVKNSGSGAITVDADGSETIDGGANVSLATQYDSVTVQSDGANWIIISRI